MSFPEAADRPSVRRVGRLLNRALRPGGIELRPVSQAAAPGVTESPLVADRLSTDLLHSEAEWRASFSTQANPILQRHRDQTSDTIAALRKRYAEPLFGNVRVWDLVERLACCVDPTDERLYCASQQMHVRQMLEEMEADGFATPEMILVALIHDLGKLLLLTDEDPSNIVCMNTAVGEHEDGAGLDNCLIQWNHDEFAYERFKDLIPDELAWLIRYHSIELPGAHRLMDARDLERSERLLVPFAHYDHATKTPFHLPGAPISRYRDIIEEAFPDPIRF
jgi:myo-inositol oxygenase